MKVGDLVWSLDYKYNGMTTQIKMAIIVEIGNYYDDSGLFYVLQLIENGRRFRTTRYHIGEMNEYWDKVSKKDNF